MDRIQEIMAVPGIDVGFIGPHDLGLSMGLRAEEIGKNPEHERQLMRVLEGCQAVGKPAGLPAPDATAANKWILRGFQMIDLSNDLALLRRSIRSQLAEVKR